MCCLIMNIRTQVFIFFLIANSLFVFSQIEAFVVDVDNQPIMDVDIFFVDQNLLIKRNEKGVFTIDSNLPDNSYLELYKFGYKSSVVQYKYGQDLIIVLNKMHVELDEIGIQENVSFLDFQLIFQKFSDSLYHKCQRTQRTFTQRSPCGIKNLPQNQTNG